MEQKRSRQQAARGSSRVFNPLQDPSTRAALNSRSPNSPQRASQEPHRPVYFSSNKMEGGGESIKAETINIVVRDQTGGEVHFKVKPQTKFSKVIDAYCSKKAVSPDTMR